MNISFSKLSASGTNGQFRTPRHIIDLIVALVDPQPGQRICDPACGTAGFLISAFTHILRQNTKAADLKRGNVDGALLKPAQWKFLEEQAFTGFDNDANMVKIAILNLYLAPVGKGARLTISIRSRPALAASYPGQLFDVILANPPFAGKVQDESILADLNYKLNTRATELLFLKWFIDHLTPSGRAGVIVPNGVLFGSTNAATKLREMLLTECDLASRHQSAQRRFQTLRRRWHCRADFPKEAHRRNPSGSTISPPTASASTTNAHRLKPMTFPMFSTKWPNREEGPNSYRVPIEKIKENDWSLAAGRYKPVTTETVNHDRARRYSSRRSKGRKRNHPAR